MDEVRPRRKTVRRIVISARVTEDSARGWRDFAVKNGVSLAAFIEAAGLELLNETIPPTSERRKRMIETARAIDVDRRRRSTGRRGKS